jgi:DNA-binding NtrC family response regulator
MNRRKGILVIDDDPGINRFLCNALEEEYDVHMALSGEEGLRSLTEVHPHLILLDLNMPRLGGLAVLRRLHDMPRHAPVVIITAYGKIESAVQAMRLGAIDYIEKPIALDKLRRQIREWFALRR